MQPHGTCFFSMIRTKVPDDLVAMDCPPVDFYHELLCFHGLAVSASAMPMAVGAQLCASGYGHRKVLMEKVHCMSLSSIHIHYNHDPVQAQVWTRWTV